VIEAEQWLASNGWRGAIVAMSSSRSTEFLDGFEHFRARLEARERRMGDLERDRARARRAMRSAIIVAVVAVVVAGAFAVRLFFEPFLVG
jgi:hypothetical protein